MGGSLAGDAGCLSELLMRRIIDRTPEVSGKVMGGRASNAPPAAAVDEEDACCCCCCCCWAGPGEPADEPGIRALPGRPGEDEESEGL